MPVGSLQIDRDLSYQRRQWMVERIGWTMMSFFIIAAVAGLFGDGIWSTASVGDGKEMTIEYERFVRYLAPTTLRVYLRAHSEDDNVHIRINRDFLRAAKIENVVPLPTSVVIGDNWLSYNFTVHSPGQVRIKFDLTHETAGRVLARISVGNGGPLSFHQFVYP